MINYYTFLSYLRTYYDVYCVLSLYLHLTMPLPSLASISSVDMNTMLAL